MSWFDAIYGRPGRGLGPDEPEKKGLARFAQILGRDFGQLIATNFVTCICILPAAMGVSLGVILLNFPFTLLAGLVTGLPAGIGLLLMADCCMRSLCNDPSPWMYRAVQTVKTRWKAALPLGALTVTLLGGLCFVWAFLFALLDGGGQYPGGAVLAFLGFDMLALAVGGGLALAVLVAAAPSDLRLGELFRGAGRMLLLAPARSIGGSAVLFAGAAVLIVFFPVSTFWAILFGFWLPVLAAMQLFFPVLRRLYDLEVEAAETAPEPDAALTEKQKKAARRANWWHYHWGLVVAVAVLASSVVYVIHGLNTTIDPDYSVAVVTADTLPDASAQRLQAALEAYGEDRNRDGVVLVELNVYTWSADASLTDMNSQMAGATRLNTDLANGYSGIWILADPAGFEEAYGALSETLGADWESQLYSWADVPALANAGLGSYDTTADGSASQSVQELFAGYKVAVLDDSAGLWAALTAQGE